MIEEERRRRLAAIDMKLRILAVWAHHGPRLFRYSENAEWN